MVERYFFALQGLFVKRINYGTPFVAKFNPMKYIFNPILYRTFFLFNLWNIDLSQSFESKYLFNPIVKIFIQSSKYSFNPIQKIFIQSNPENIHSIQCRKYLFNPIVEIFVQSNREDICSIQSRNIHSILKIFHAIFLGRARPSWVDQLAVGD